MASEEKEKAWVKIVPSLIIGGAMVLAAMLPLYYSSQKRLKEVTQTAGYADSVGDALRKQLAGLESQVQRCEAEKKRLLAQHGSVTTAPFSSTESATEVVDHDFKFNLKECKLENSVVRCAFIVTNLMGDRELSLGEGRIIDDSGNEYPIEETTLGATSGSSARLVLPGAVAVKGAVKFASVRPGTKKLALLEIAGYNWPASGGRDHIVVKFREIAM